MTLVQTQPRPANAAPLHLPVAEAMDTTGPRVHDDMTVEVALSVMASALTGHLSVTDDDGVCTGLVTRAQLTAVRASSAYSDRLRLRDLTGDGGPSAPPATPAAGRAPRHRPLVARCPGDGQDSARGLLAPVR
ncbi:CBS domain-containing protein [Streptomyces sp. NPDC012794]|uniref:CBS domain-containing protein n=1 Tax=Streptomyces sp. NPDC012794 TaxID=3364850 RepID=UPI0036A4913D